MKIDFGALNEEKKPKKDKVARDVVPVDPFDIEDAKKMFLQFKEQINSMVDQSQAHKITDDASHKNAITMMGQARSLSKKVTVVKDDKLRPHNDYRNSIIKMSKYFVDPLEQIVSSLKQKDGQYLTSLRIEEQKRAREEAKKKADLQADLDKQADDAGVNRVELPDTPKTDVVEKTTRTESGSSLSVTYHWKGIVVDEDKVDRQFCSSDQKKIDAAVKAGLRANSPKAGGLKIEEVPTQRLRA